MERLKMKVDVREVGRKGANHRLRVGGFIPAVLYGQGEKTLGLSVPAKEFTTMMREAGINALIEIEIAGENRKDPLVVMLKDYQTDLLTHRLTHVDLLKINLKEKVTVKIPIQLAGKAVGVMQGGVIEQTRRELEAKCLPGNIPEVIEIDISHLGIGDSLHFRDLKLPEGVEAIGEVDFTIVSIVAPREEEAAPTAPAAVEGAAPEAGAPVAGEAAPAAEPKGEKTEKTEKGEKK